MGGPIRGIGICIGLVVLSCGGRTSAYPSVDGEYWWYGTRLFFEDGKYGPTTDFAGLGTWAPPARLLTERGQLFLDIPACSRIRLERSGGRGETLTGEQQDCELPRAQIEAGQWRKVMALRIDLERRVLHWRYCYSSAAGSGCVTEDAVFVPLAELGGAGLGGAGSAPPLTVGDTRSDAMWTFTSGEASLWACDVFEQDGCTSGPGIKNQLFMGATGAVHQLQDGRFYLEGFDCLAPAGYEGEPLSCGESLAGLPEIPVPVPWVTRLIVVDDHLSFHAELVGADYKYFVRLDAPLTRF